MELSYRSPKEIRIHRTLSNGQVMSLYLEKETHTFTDGFDYDCWLPALCIGPSRRANNKWFKQRNKPVIPAGKRGMEGLMLALCALEEFIQWRCEVSQHLEYVVVMALDDRRFRAYSRLLRRGFSKGRWNHGHCYEDCYMKLI